MATTSPLNIHHKPATATDKSHHLPNNRGFVNPWPSWVKPTLAEIWSGLSWGESNGEKEIDEINEGHEVASSATTQLDVVQPDFGKAGEKHPGRVRTWWLGHAGVLVEFPGSEGQEPMRILFDPIFSQRCSPSQYWGPTRFYKAPCKASDLPPVHIVLISHNHYDHLDANTISELWKLNKDHMRFVLPLGNREWMESLLGPDCGSRIWIADWWDEAEFWTPNGGEENLDTAIKLGQEKKREGELLSSSSSLTLGDHDEGDDEARPRNRDYLRIVCTPAQHGSGRFAYDTGSSLWASYNVFFHHASSPENPFHLFFGGDTGYRLRPPPPALPFPPCPAFLEMHEKLGDPDLLLLPISIGSTHSYIKSWDPIGIVPKVDGGLMAQNHLDEWEALDVARILSGQSLGDKDFKEQYMAQQSKADLNVDRQEWALRGERSQQPKASLTTKRPLAVAIHFGTFSPPAEALGNLAALREACGFHSWRYARSYDPEAGTDAQSNGTFLVLNHGERTEVAMPTSKH